jgi:hypothetical protein
MRDLNSFLSSAVVSLIKVGGGLINDGCILQHGGTRR